MTVTKEEVDFAVSHPKIVHAVDLAHLAWCEELNRQRPGWGSRYLQSAQLEGLGLRVRAAAVLAVVKDARCDLDDLLQVEPNPVVSSKQIERFLHHPLLFHYMTLANDAWDDEMIRARPDLKPDLERIPFMEKYYKAAKPLFAASQIAVLKCVPTIRLGRVNIHRLENSGTK